MRLRKIPGAEEKVSGSSFVVHDVREKKGKWNTVFKNDNPIHLEIGMGKGKFITTLSKMNPDINYLGMEKFESVLVRAVEKREAEEEPSTNLYFMCEDATALCEFFADNEISRIYLNFSDPWPKARHAVRRLTSESFLEAYARVLVPGGEVIFKTDNDDLFAFSVEEMRTHGWVITELTNDLHNSEYAVGNVMTEYETKFRKLGKRINRLAAHRE